MENWVKIAKEFFPKEFEGFKRSLSGGRRPDAVSFTDIEGDVKRRDLTINALFYDIDTHEVVDLVGGVNDLKNGIVRTVGKAEDRFGEDRLRILRAIRFAGRFGNELDPETDMALQKDSNLEGISGERIRDEFIKGLVSTKSTKHLLSMINKYDLFKWIFGGLKVDKTVLRTLPSDYHYEDYIVVIARLLKNNSISDLKKVLNDLKYSSDEIKAITFLVSMLSLDVDTAFLLKKAQQTSGVNNEQIRIFCGDEGVSSQLIDAFEEYNLSISGPEAIEITGLKPGPELGKAIKDLETKNFEKILSLK